jgi:hypothetical protein
VATLVGADCVYEMPVAVVAMGEGFPALDAIGSAVAGDTDAEPLEFPLITAAQRTGEHSGLGPPWPWGTPVDVPGQGADPIEAVVLARGSQRRMDPARGLPERLLRTSLEVALTASCSPTVSWCPTSTG